jgi:hypothetical protein
MLKYIRPLLITLLLKLLGIHSYKKMSEKEIGRLFSVMAKSQDLKKLPDFFEQCADAYKNQFLYTQDPQYKGMVLAFILLRERFIEHKPATKTKEAARQKKFVGNRRAGVKY